MSRMFGLLHGLRLAVTAETERRLGSEAPCARCGATLATFNALCAAGHADAGCPGLDTMERVRRAVQAELGWP
jgi:hypothetical protein